MTSGQTVERRQNFPMETFRDLEDRIRELRIEIMRRAVEIAEKEDTASSIFTVKPDHVCRALDQLLDEPQLCKELMGLTE